MNGFHKLSNRLNKIASKIDERGSEVAVVATKAIVRELAFRTPVDTSTAISNWIVGIGAPVTKQISPHVPGSRGSSQVASALKTISDANQILKAKKPGQNIYISNSLDYIADLNRGGSTQAPAAFVEMSVMAGKSVVRNAKARKL
jgi:hypothetical protein